MKHFVLLLLTFAFANINLLAQEADEARISKYTFYGEAGTNIIVSTANLNFEFLLHESQKGKLHLYGRTGYGASTIFWRHSGQGGIIATTFLSSTKKHHFEFDLGAFIGYDNDYKTEFYVPLIDLGYRFQKKGSSFLFKAKFGTTGLGLAFGYAL